MRSQWLRLGVAACLLAWPGVSPANNLTENVGWQFLTSADKANRAYLEDLRQKKRNGYYAAPNYITNIERQYNCSVTATATGNSSASNAAANAPSTTGHASSSTGNANASSITSGFGTGTSSNLTDQVNTGSVSSRTSGNISTSVRGDNQQILNTDQENTGDQTASVTGSTACQYGALN